MYNHHKIISKIIDRLTNQNELYEKDKSSIRKELNGELTKFFHRVNGVNDLDKIDNTIGEFIEKITSLQNELLSSAPTPTTLFGKEIALKWAEYESKKSMFTETVSFLHQLRQIAQAAMPAKAVAFQGQLKQVASATSTLSIYSKKSGADLGDITYDPNELENLVGNTNHQSNLTI
jgi:hypothetical protein